VLDNWMSIAGIAVAVILAAVGLWLIFGGVVRGNASRGRHAERRPSRAAFRQTEPETPPPPKRAALIVNPTKVASVAQVRATAEQVCARNDWAPPLLLETTADDPGFGQAREALAQGVDLVCVLGGDGTVRTVAQVLVGGSVPMGLLSGGTGNLLARNLELPFGDVEGALETALNGRNRRIDVGWVTVNPTPAQRAVVTGEVADDAEATEDFSGEEIDPEHLATVVPDPAAGAPENRHAYLVMCGIGFDAAIMDTTSEELKAKMGWPAYFAMGFKKLFIERFNAELILDGGAPIKKHARCVLAGNCGKLTGGILLMPEAEVDDGILDLAVITPKSIAGWFGIAAHVLAKKPRAARLERYRASTILVTVDDPQLIELDGDVVGEVNQILIEVEPRALIVRVDASVRQTDDLAAESLAGWPT
jgi:diacylglycerol kinase (ATP)